MNIDFVRTLGQHGSGQPVRVGFQVLPDPVLVFLFLLVLEGRDFILYQILLSVLMGMGPMV